MLQYLLCMHSGQNKRSFAVLALCVILHKIAAMLIEFIMANNNVFTLLVCLYFIPLDSRETFMITSFLTFVPAVLRKVKGNLYAVMPGEL